MSENGILATAPLASQWQTLDPFLFCVHHRDAYPGGNDEMGPERSLLRGRNIGADFSMEDGWSMYHGDVISGFPRHPHRGFETVTLARCGYVDHSDSLGAAARFGQGDVQWMTAGRGIVHSEMFPLVRRNDPNPIELFQIWLNLPAEDKLRDPHFTMFWSEEMPRTTRGDDAGQGVELVYIAGAPPGQNSPAPPPDSWASRPQAEVAIWTLKLDARARFTLPSASVGLNRVIYFFDGQSLNVAGHALDLGERGHAIQLRSDCAIALENGAEESELLLLQGRPIGEAVAQHGPFVMNTSDEIRQAMADYQATQFGGWPWGSDAPAHERDQGRFARHPDGTVEQPHNAGLKE